MTSHRPRSPHVAASEPARAVAGPHLIVDNNTATANTRKPRRPRTPPHEMHRLNAEVVAGLAMEMREAVRLYADAVRSHDPITERALLREIFVQAGYVYQRAVNLADMIARAAPGGAA